MQEWGTTLIEIITMIILITKISHSNDNNDNGKNNKWNNGLLSSSPSPLPFSQSLLPLPPFASFFSLSLFVFFFSHSLIILSVLPNLSPSLIYITVVLLNLSLWCNLFSKSNAFKHPNNFSNVTNILISSLIIKFYDKHQG